MKELAESQGVDSAPISFMTEPSFSRRELLKYAGAGAGGLALSSAFPAFAAAGADISLSPGTGPPTTSLTVRGRRFVANEGIEVVFDQTVVAQTQATSKGTFEVEFPVETSTQPGDHLVLARGLVSKLQAARAFTVQTDWAQLGFDPAHTGSNPYENTITPENAGGLVVVWSDAFGKVSPSQPVVAGAQVVVGTEGGTLFALDARNGKQVWSVVMGGAVAAPTVADKVAYVASAFSPDTPCNLRAVEVVSAKTLWEASFPTAVLTSPAVAEGRVFVGDDDGILIALAASSGQELWKAVYSGAVLGSPAVSGGRVYAGSVFVPSNPRNLKAFDTATGALLWEAEAGVSVLGSPALPADGSIVVFGREDGSLHALDAASGKQVWEKPPGTTGGIAASPIQANGVVFMPDEPCNIVGVRAATGEVLVNVEFDGVGISSPAVAGGRLFVGTDDGVHALALGGV